jgi:hypothetical protein
MKKKIINFTYFASITFACISINNAFADRGPSVEPFVEVDIESNNAQNAPAKSEGFNFNKQNTITTRRPAGIVSKSGTTSPYAYIGPIIFLLALPFAIWMAIARKSSESNSEEKLDYYSKTFQFKPYKTEYQKIDNENDDDIDYPKAS